MSGEEIKIYGSQINLKPTIDGEGMVIRSNELPLISFKNITEVYRLHTAIEEFITKHYHGPNTLCCPLCGAQAILKELEAKGNWREDKSYIWVCDHCPGIVLEWWDDKDTEAFNKYINFHEGVIRDYGEDDRETTNIENTKRLDSKY